jgi:hypothetical protein
MPEIYQTDPQMMDWTTYLVDREFAVYKGKVPVGIGYNRYKNLRAGTVVLTKQVLSPEAINYHKMYQMVTKYTKWQQNIPNGNKIYQMAIKYTKWQQNIPNGNKIYLIAIK